MTPLSDSLRTVADGTQSLRRAVVLLRLLSTRTSTGWRLSDLAGESGLDHTTVHRLLSALVDERLATRVSGTRRYTVGPLAFELGVSAASHFGLDRLAAPALAQLAGTTRDIVFLNVRSGFESVCIARHDGRAALKAYTVNVGTRRPLCLSAGGIAMLIELPKAEQAEIESQNLRAIDGRDESHKKSIRRMLARSRRAGYGLNMADVIPGITAVGVAIRNAAGAPVASLSLAARENDLEEIRRAQILALLSAQAETIAGHLTSLRY